MNEEELEKYMRAGEIAARVKKEVLNLVRSGMKLLDIAEYVENRITNLGGKPAFPCNLSLDNVAAHFTPEPIDTDLTIPEESVLKIDLGVHVDGFIADTAVTVAFDPRNEILVEAGRRVLEEALRAVKPGLSFYKFGGIIEDAAKSLGFNIVKNLSGHSLAQYRIHAGEVVPNCRDRLVMGSFREGRAYAIEPFVTRGIGLVTNGDRVTIYALKPRGKLKKLSDAERRFYEQVLEERRTLPFTLRWYTSMLRYEDGVSIVKKLAQRGLIVEYPVLVEVSSEPVAQFEETVVIYKGKVYVTTQT